jgi:branched-chain amino acid transport system permease protein
LVGEGVLMQFGLRPQPGGLRIKRGTIHGLIGPNGQSTMMNVLTGIYVPTAGCINPGATLLGEPRILRCRHCTFQNVQLFGEMTACKRAGAGLHHADSNIVDVALHTPRQRGVRLVNRGMGCRFVGLGDLEDAHPLPTASSACWKSPAPWRWTRNCCSTSRPA